MRRKTKKIIISSIIFLLTFFILLVPIMRPYTNQFIYRDAMDHISEAVLSANIKIIQLKHRTNENNTSVSISAGFSGVVIHKEGQKYYALTALHAIEKTEDKDKAKMIVLGYDNLDFKDSVNGRDFFGGINEYYEQFPEVMIEYSNYKYDLAVISFSSDEAYSVLTVAEEAPKYKDVVVSMSNPYNKRNIVTAGRVISKNLSSFGDEAGEMQYPIIRHTSFISEGSSGSALLSEDSEIVGINLGGSKNIMGNYIAGMAMPSNSILNFLEEWKLELSEY